MERRALRRLVVLLLLTALPAALASAGSLIDPLLNVDIPSADDTLRLRQLEVVAASARPDVVGFRGDLGSRAGITLDVSHLGPDTARGGAAALRSSTGDTDVTAIGLTVKGASPGVVQPYVGVGPAVFLTRSVGFDARSPRRPQDLSLADGAVADRIDSSVGLQAQAGIRLSLSPDLDLFGEYRFMRPSYEMPGRLEGEGGRPGSLLNGHHFQGGLSIRF